MQSVSATVGTGEERAVEAGVRSNSRYLAVPVELWCDSETLPKGEDFVWADACPACAVADEYTSDLVATLEMTFFRTNVALRKTVRAWDRVVETVLVIPSWVTLLCSVLRMLVVVLARWSCRG